MKRRKANNSYKGLPLVGDDARRSKQTPAGTKPCGGFYMGMTKETREIVIEA